MTKILFLTVRDAYNTPLDVVLYISGPRVDILANLLLGEKD